MILEDYLKFNLSNYSIPHLTNFARTSFLLKIWNFSVLYDSVHGYIGVSVCIIGALFNMYFLSFNRLQQFRTYINTLLSFVAMANTLVMMTMAIYLFHYHENFTKNLCNKFASLVWAIFGLVHAYTSVTLYGLSINLTVFIALMRVHNLRNGVLNRSAHKISPTQALLVTFTIAVLFCIPVYLSTYINHSSVACNGEGKYVIGQSSLVKKYGILITIMFVCYAIGLKLLPCIILTISLVLLIHKIRQAGRRRKRLLGVTLRHTNSVSIALATILLLFTVTQIPQVILNVLLGAKLDPVLRVVILRLGNFCDLLSLINSSVSFPLYCVMNRHNRLLMSNKKGFTKKLTSIRRGFSSKGRSHRKKHCFGEGRA